MAEQIVPARRAGRRLIELLAAEPRIGVLECSRRLGVARGTVQARLDKLVARGVIRGFGPEIAPAAIGFGVTAFVTLEISQRHGHDPVAAHLPRDPRGAGGAHHHRLRRPAVPDRRPVQHRPAAGDRPDRGVRGRSPGRRRSSRWPSRSRTACLPLVNAASVSLGAGWRAEQYGGHSRHGLTSHIRSTRVNRRAVGRAVTRRYGDWMAKGRALREVLGCCSGSSSSCWRFTGVLSPFLEQVWALVSTERARCPTPAPLWQQRLGGTPRSATIAGDAVVVEHRTLRRGPQPRPPARSSGSARPTGRRSPAAAAARRSSSASCWSRGTRSSTRRPAR